MKIFPPELVIKDYDGFVPEKDIFKRSELGEGLTNLVTSVADPMVIALDAEWGSGKTVFLKMWAGELRKLGVPVVYFDAFAHDHLDDAFLTLAAEVIALAQAKKGDKKPIESFTAKAVGASKVLASGAARLAVKAAVRGVTAGTLSAADIEDEVSDVIAQDASNLADKQIAELLHSTQERKDTLEAFRSALSELPALVEKDADGSNGADHVLEEIQNKPLIFIIDELDRCTPPFALSLLERIKHFFSVPNVQFVLGVHLDQLANSVKATYGADIDARSYLQKFIHIPVPLLDTSRYENDATAKKYVEYLTRSFKFEEEHGRLVQLIEEAIIEQAQRRNMSLRTIERIYTTIAIALATLPQNRLAIAPLMVGLAILKILHPELYREAKRGKLKYGQVEKLFGFHEPPTDSHNRHRHDWTVGFWRYTTDPEASDEIIRKYPEYSEAMHRYHLDNRFDVLPHLANAVLGKFTPG